jgi:ubiquinone/menaquinone biosynthesis C-methylase UbiE
MTYVFDNAAPQARARLTALADVHDSGTIRHLVARGVADGWKCLEVGGGLGTITRWLSDRVGTHGSVLTTDIDTRFLETIDRANVDVRQHDILIDPLPAATFDLVYARLVLEHLPEPDVALDRMVMALKPGGWLLVEDFELQAAAPDDAAVHLPPTWAAMRRVAARAGVDPRLGLSLGQRLRSRHLTNVGHEGRVQLCRGKTAAARLLRLNFEQLREEILAAGVTPPQFDADLARLDDEQFEWRSPTLWSAWGQRPS